MGWFIRVRGLLAREKLRNEIDEELEFHLSMRQQWSMDRGVPQQQARRAARLRFGSPSLWRERITEVDLLLLPQSILQDLRHGLRLLKRNPGFTAAAVLALALGIGVNTAAFTAYKAFFARPLDARDPGHLVNMALISSSGAPRGWFSYPDFEAYREHLHSFQGVTAEKVEQLTVSDAGQTLSQSSSVESSLAGEIGLLPAGGSNKEFADTMVVSENYFAVLGVTPIRGRVFPDQAQLAAVPAVLISENYWRRRFGLDPSLLGKVIRLDGIAFTVIGVTPRDFAGTSFVVPDFWFPISQSPLLHPSGLSLSDREDTSYRLHARLAPGVTISQAQAEMNLLARHLAALHDPHSDWAKPAQALVWPGSPFPLPLTLNQFSVVSYAVLLILLGVGLVLAIACANVASLQLARAASRQGELSMRLSLGASRLRIIRQLLTESALLGLLAGIVGFLLSWLLTKAGAEMASQIFPAEYGTLIFHVNPDLGVFAYVFGLSLLAGLLFGLTPALESSGTALASALKATKGTPTLRSGRLRDLFIAAEVAAALVLMIVGTLLLQSLVHALRVAPGYDVNHLVSLDLNWLEAQSRSAADQATLIRELRTRLAALPAVAAITHAPSPVFGGRDAAVSLNSQPPSIQDPATTLMYRYVQDNYFQTVAIPLLSGQNFDLHAEQPQPAVIVSESAAQLLWPNQNPIGRGLRLAATGQPKTKGELIPDGPVYQVIAVAGDTHGASFDGSDAVQIYLQMPESRLQELPILIRTRSDPRQLIPAIHAAVTALAPNLEASSYTVEQMLHESSVFFVTGFAAAIATPVGLIGLFLASMGIYGTVSYCVVLRTREVGIRMALGARKLDVLVLMLREVTRPVMAGLLAGMVLAVGASYLLRGVLHGLGLADSLSFAAVSALFLLIALFAAWLPSLRAMRVNPTVALRHE